MSSSSDIINDNNINNNNINNNNNNNNPCPYYPIGTHGTPWGPVEKSLWFEKNKTIKRNYKEEVITIINTIKSENNFKVGQYGALSGEETRYPLFYICTINWNNKKPSLLITGGVHGYEKSGVHGALLFITSGKGKYYEDYFNILVCPCVSPWGYETINRWNRSALDPNRYFYDGSPVEECQLLISFINSFSGNINNNNNNNNCENNNNNNNNKIKFNIHFDLHETTDTDLSEFMPAKYARDGEIEFIWEEIPDGFYIMGSAINYINNNNLNNNNNNNNNKTPSKEQFISYLSSIINSVKKITHIAKPDNNNNIIGINCVGDGAVIDYENPIIYACDELLHAKYAVTTEVYPNSKNNIINDNICNNAHVAGVDGGLMFIINNDLLGELV